MEKLLATLLLIFVSIPLSIFVSMFLWNATLVPAVTWANPVSFWQMAGLMLLFWIIWPGNKTKITMKNDE